MAKQQGGKSKHTGSAWKMAYKAYQMSNTYERNRIKRLKRHLKAFPEDKAAKGALERIESAGAAYRRKKPVMRGMVAYWDSEKNKTLHRLQKVARTFTNETVTTIAAEFHKLPHPKRGQMVEATIRANPGQYVRIY